MSSGLWNLAVFYEYDNLQDEDIGSIFKVYLHPVDGSRIFLQIIDVCLQTCTVSSQNTKNWTHPAEKT
jgi:hypothetical protein